MDLKTIPVEDPLWSEVLKTLPHDVYHLPEYVALDAHRSNRTGHAFVARQDDCAFFMPYLLRSCADIGGQEFADIHDAISPYGYAGILASEPALRNPDFLASALEALLQSLRADSVCSAYLRLHPIFSRELASLLPQNMVHKIGQTVSVDLALTESEIWARTRKGHQSTINKCMRLGFSARTVPVTEYLGVFMDIYAETMNRVHAREEYYFTREYFESLAELRQYLHLGVVELDGEVICASLFLECCGVVQAHLGGTKTKYLALSPFNLLLHYMRLWSKARGNAYLHLGSGLGGREDALFSFKAGFSKTRHDFWAIQSIVEPGAYDQLIDAAARLSDRVPDDLRNSRFFPAYRAR